MKLALDKQLLADTHFLYELDKFLILLNNNALIPWLILVPKTEETELCFLEESFYNETQKFIKYLSSFTRDYFKADKMNIASLGNRVSQLHIHIVARKEDDICFPKPIWGNITKKKTYSQENLEKLKDALYKHLKAKDYFDLPLIF